MIFSSVDAIDSTAPLGVRLGFESDREDFTRQGSESTPDSTPDGFMRHMQNEYLRYQAVIQQGGIRPE